MAGYNSIDTQFYGRTENLRELKKMFIFQTYNGEPSKPNECCYHPGVPIFHEGLKFWSCCQRKTTDFQSFLNQEGCTWGVCKWRKDNVRLL